jgi:hypothetical protein
MSEIPIVAFIVIFIYLFIGPALIMINQYILKSLSFPYPMFLSGLGIFSFFFYSIPLPSSFSFSYRCVSVWYLCSAIGRIQLCEVTEDGSSRRDSLV